MKVGCPKEIKVHEYRVGLTPESAAELVRAGHEVFLETKAGEGIGAPDSVYEKVGVKILPNADAVFETAEMIVKVKEPQAVEIARLKPHHTLFTYLHLAPDPAQAEGLIKSGATCIAYETVTDRDGRLPLLKPMSEVAGRMAIQVGAYFLEKAHGGRGVLLGGVPELDREFNGRLETVYSTTAAVAEAIKEADVVVGAVLVAGAAAPKLITRDMLKTMKPGSVLVDISIDQGGCFETSKATTHSEPTFVVDGIVHYCVANMPGAVSRTSAFALNNATLPFTLALANKGYKKALQDDPHLANGLNVYAGAITHEAVAKDLGKPFKKPDWLN
ncbi:MAG: alanine dehydrogenase [Caulobacteraceae bacterium]|nr:alanine dehydrogenase [Caulobacteraceae bacterium]